MLVTSIILEAAVAIVAILAARKGKPYIYGLAFTFGAYVLYDLARLLQWDVQGGVLSGLFLLATITALIAVWGLYREERSDNRLEEVNHVETSLDRRARNADSRTRGGATGRDPGPSRHLERRERVDHPRDGQSASCRSPVGRAAAQQRRVHRDHRQAGRSPLLRHVFLAARQRKVRRRDLAQQHDFGGRRRWLYGRHDLGAKPHGVVLHAPVANHANGILHGADQAAVAWAVAASEVCHPAQMVHSSRSACACDARPVGRRMSTIGAMLTSSAAVHSR